MSELFQAVVDSATDAIAVLDADGRVGYANPATWELLGLEPQELDAVRLLDLVHPDDAARAADHLQQAMVTPGDGPVVELRVAGRGDQWRHVESRSVNLLDDPRVRGVVLRVRDVSDKAHLDRALRTLGEGNQALVRSADERSLLQGMCETVVQTGGYRLAWVGYAEDDAARSVRPVASAGAVDYVADLRITWADEPRGRGPTGTAVRTGTVQVTHDMRDAPSFLPWRDRALAHGFRTSLVLPLRKQHRVIGALSIYSDEVGAFDPPSVALLQELADDLAYGIARLRDGARLARSLEATIGALAAMSELRDPYTAGHQCRVGALARAIAEELGLPDETARGIQVAGELHDVGKVAVPTEILSRPARLTVAEMELVKCHPQAGHDIVRGIDFPWPVAAMVLQHHERLDGSGYPAGLRGDQVHVGSRVLAVADTVEAMSNHRPYRPGLGLDQALAEVRAGAGRRYDPDVVEACARLFEEDRFSYTPPRLSAEADWVVPLAPGIPLPR